MLEDIQCVKRYLSGPIYFIRGNHEDFDWLHGKSAATESSIVPIDPVQLFQYVKDGTVLHTDGHQIAFLGGVESGKVEAKAIDIAAYEKLLKLAAGEIDVLVTHDAPYGINVNFHGEIQGSIQITRLIEQLQPRYHIAGHYHHMNGPRRYGKTTYLGLNVLVNLREGEQRRIQPGSLAVLDTTKNRLDFVDDDWLSGFNKDFDFHAFVQQMMQTKNLSHP